MVNCKMAMEDIQSSGCGQIRCCHFCPDKDDCNFACDSTADCPDMVKEPDPLEVMQNLLPDRIQEVTDLMIQVKKAEERIVEIKESLLKAMEDNGVKKFENEQISFTYVGPSIRTTFDKKKLEKDHPELDLSKYNKTSAVKASVRIQVK